MSVYAITIPCFAQMLRSLTTLLATPANMRQARALFQAKNLKALVA